MFDPKQKITKMQGKDYLEVKWRVVWFRDENPKGRILTDLLPDGIVKATIIDGEGNTLATGHGTPKMQGVAKSRPVEGAETAAIGRALAHAGYGTQFTDEDEGEHLADSPVERQPEPYTRTWTLQQKQAVVDGGYAEHINEAKNMLDHSVLKENSGVTTVTSWAKHYRAARDEDKTVIEAAQIANDVYMQAKAGKQ
jgi:hypothetical protein